MSMINGNSIRQLQRKGTNVTKVYIKLVYTKDVQCLTPAEVSDAFLIYEKIEMFRL